jgi:hypothetical protein
MPKRGNENIERPDGPPRKKRRENPVSGDVGASGETVWTLRKAIVNKLVEIPESLRMRATAELLEDPVWNLVHKTLGKLKVVKLSWVPADDSAGN